MSNYALLTATTLVKTSAGKVKGFFVSTASSSPTIEVIDSEDGQGSTVVVAEFTPTAATNYNFYDGITTAQGLYVVIGGTVEVTFYYE